MLNKWRNCKHWLTDYRDVGQWQWQWPSLDFGRLGRVLPRPSLRVCKYENNYSCIWNVLL